MSALSYHIYVPVNVSRCERIHRSQKKNNPIRSLYSRVPFFYTFVNSNVTHAQTWDILPQKIQSSHLNHVCKETKTNE